MFESESVPVIVKLNAPTAAGVPRGAVIARRAGLLLLPLHGDLSPEEQEALKTYLSEEA